MRKDTGEFVEQGVLAGVSEKPRGHLRGNLLETFSDEKRGE